MAPVTLARRRGLSGGKPVLEQLCWSRLSPDPAVRTGCRLILTADSCSRSPRTLPIPHDRSRLRVRLAQQPATDPCASDCDETLRPAAILPRFGATSTQRFRPVGGPGSRRQIPESGQAVRDGILLGFEREILSPAHGPDGGPHRSAGGACATIRLGRAALGGGSLAFGRPRPAGMPRGCRSSDSRAFGSDPDRARTPAESRAGSATSEERPQGAGSIPVVFSGVSVGRLKSSRGSTRSVEHRERRGRRRSTVRAKV